MTVPAGNPASTTETALREIYERHGRLDPGTVVDEARDPNHPLHNKFDWDDASAAEAHRQEQARFLIRSVKIWTVVKPTEPPKQVRIFHHDPASDGYHPIEIVVSNVDLQARILAEMEQDFLRLQRRWSAHADVFSAMVARLVGDVEV